MRSDTQTNGHGEAVRRGFIAAGCSSHLSKLMHVWVLIETVICLVIMVPKPLRFAEQMTP